MALGILLIASISSASQDSPARSQTITSGIDLVVVDRSGAAIPKAQVTITDSRGVDIVNARTDRSGRFTVSQVPAGTYKLAVRADGFQSSAKPIAVLDRQIAELSIALTLAASPTFTPTPTAAPVGNNLAFDLTVQDENGAVIVGASISVIQDKTGAKFVGRTNERGVYNASALAPGSYTVSVESYGFAPHETNLTLRQHEDHKVTITMVVQSIVDWVVSPSSE